MTRIPEDPAGVFPDPATITVDGQSRPARAGESVAAALIADGRAAWRETRTGGKPRGVFCGIGACFDCLVTVNGETDVRACLRQVCDGDEITTTAPEVSARPPRVPAADVSVPIVVVGAGPAGLHAALAAAGAGARVLLLDSNPRGGGQYHRQLPESFRASRPEKAHPGQAEAAALLARIAGHELIEHRPNTTVWAAEAAEPALRPGGSNPAEAGEAGHVLHTTTGTVRAERVVLATGAYDRAVPFPGWDLPGVYTAGAAQALVKGQRVRPGSRMLVGGTGPFLLPVASGLLAAGVKLEGVLEANRPAGGWLRRPGILASAPSKLLEAAKYNLTLARHGLRVANGQAIVAVHGSRRVEAATVARLRPDWTIESTRTVEVDAVAIGYGFTPQLELAIALGCSAGAFVDVDSQQLTSVPGVYAAGELTGIGGAVLSAAEGRIAGLAAAGAVPDQRAARTRGRYARFATALAEIYPVRDGWQSWLDETTLVCRCEEVSYQTIRDTVTEHAVTGTKTLKLCTRAGLGWCQGRVCGRNVADLTGLPAADHRPVASPICLGDLAGA
ncbi:2Fe-2S iron-sulfur cluster-binding protein [Longispora albida]|uniref:2Fe-2S iron-sulfur cluster-binding protein n=1 Tax=Longispora albida TaxID=203523 RepID=UPI00037A693C|nr:2Fe-2S iron-sulfur cluster-binding protein [Longispora albida]